METTYKEDVIVALKNTAKGQLNYDTTYGFDSLEVCVSVCGRHT